MDVVKLNFIFSNLNMIVLGIWMIFLIVVTIRFFRPAWVKNISFLKLSFVAIALNIFYGLFVTWGQYYVWANGSAVTKALLNLPLAKEVPIFEWARPLFTNHLGYFSYYVWGRTWLDIFILFLISGGLYYIFKIWESRRGNFIEQGPEILLALMLISGYPGVLVLIPLGFVFAFLLYGFSYFKGKKVVIIEPVFILATFFALIYTYTNVIQSLSGALYLNALHLFVILFK